MAQVQPNELSRPALLQRTLKFCSYLTTLCMMVVCCSIFHGGNEVVFPDQ